MTVTDPAVTSTDGPARALNAPRAASVASDASGNDAGCVAAPASNQEPLKGVARGALHLLSTQPLTWATSFLNLVLLPRLLGSRGLGQWTFVVSAASLVGLMVSLGVPNFLVRHVAAEPARGARDAAASLVLQVGVATVAALGLSVVVSRSNFPVPPVLLYILLAGMVIAAANRPLSSFLTGRERIASVAWLGAGSAVAADCVGLAVLALGGGLTLFVLSGVVLSLPILILVWRVSGLSIGREAFDPSLWRRLVLGGLPFLGWSLTQNVYGQIDKILLGFLVPTAAIGWYGAAYTIIGIPVFIPAAIITPLLPALSRLREDEETFRYTFRRSLFAALVLTVPIAAMTIGLAPAIPALLHWPRDFQRSVPLMMILSLHLPIVAMDMVLATGLFALKRERAWLCVGIVASLFNPALNLLLIPVFQRWLQNGAIGASIVTVATEVLMLAGALVVLPSGLLGRDTAWLAARTVLAGAGCFLATACLRPVFLPLAPAAGGLVFLALCLALQVIGTPDLVSLRDVARQFLARHLARSLAA